MRHEESLKDGVRSVKRRECAEGNGRSAEVCGVKVDAENGVDAGESRGRSRHTICSRLKAMLHLIPRGGAREEKLDGNTENAHPAKGSCPDGSRARGGKDEHEQSADDRRAEMAQAVGDPGENVEDRMLMGGKNA